MKKRFPYLPTGSHITGSSTKERVFEGNTFDEKKNILRCFWNEVRKNQGVRMLVTKRAPKENWALPNNEDRHGLVK